MNECISESGCVCELILPGSVSLLVVKLWDLVIKIYMLELFRNKESMHIESVSRKNIFTY